MDEEIELTTVDGQTVRVALSGAVRACGAAIHGSAYSVAGCDGERVEVRRVRDAEESERDDRAASLIKAIRAITVDMPDDQPSGEAERQLIRLEKAVEALPRGARGAAAVCDAAAKLCEALADDTRRLRIAAESYFGGDFRSPEVSA